MGRKARPKTPEKVYKPTVQIPENAKNLLVDYIERNNRPEMGMVVAKALTFLLTGPEELQVAAFATVPAGQHLNYAKALRRVADDIERTGVVPFILPTAIAKQLAAIAKDEGTDELGYLRNHLNSRSRRIVQPVVQAASPRRHSHAAHK